MARNPNRPTPMTIRLTKTERAMLSEAARDRELSVNQLVRLTLIRQGIIIDPLDRGQEREA